MRRMPLLVVALAVLAIAVGLGMSLLPAAEPTSASEQAAALAAELRCPDCQGLSVAESHTAAAQAIRDEIDAQLASGHSMEQVRASFVDRYGEWILLAPSSPLPWLVPLIALLTGGGLLLAWLGGSAASEAPAPPTPGSDAIQRVRREVEELDA